MPLSGIVCLPASSGTLPSRHHPSRLPTNGASEARLGRTQCLRIQPTEHALGHRVQITGIGAPGDVATTASNSWIVMPAIRVFVRWLSDRCRCTPQGWQKRLPAGCSDVWWRSCRARGRYRTVPAKIKQVAIGIGNTLGFLAGISKIFPGNSQAPHLAQGKSRYQLPIKKPAG
jgi:hypothetical protein